MFRSLSVSKYFALIALGIFSGYLFLFAVSMPLKWMIAIFLGVIFISLLFAHKIKTDTVLCLLILCIPLGASIILGDRSMDAHLGGASKNIEICLSHFLIAVLYMIWLFKFTGKKAQHIKFNKLDYLLMIFVFWNLLSFFKSIDVAFSIAELVKMILPMAIYFYIAHRGLSREQVNKVVLFLIVIIIAESIIAFLQVKFGDNQIFRVLSKQEIPTTMYEGSEVPRINGTIGWPTQFAQYLILLLPLPLSLSISSSKKNNALFYLMVFILGTIALILTRTRMGIILWVAVTALVFIIYILKPGYKNIMRMFGTGILIIFIGGVLTLLFRDAIIARFISYDEGSALVRIPMFKLAIEIIKNNPILGVGLNNYVNVIDQYKRFYSILAPVHNVYLFFAAEIGIPGLLILLSVFLWIIKKLVSIFVLPDRHYSAISIGLLSGIIGFMLYGMIELGFKNGYVLWNILWLLFGLIVAMSNVIHTQSDKI